MPTKANAMMTFPPPNRTSLSLAKLLLFWTLPTVVVVTVGVTFRLSGFAYLTSNTRNDATSVRIAADVVQNVHVLSTAHISHASTDDDNKGVTLHLYDNMGLAGTPYTTVLLNTTRASFTSFNKTLATPFSAEMIATISFPPTSSSSPVHGILYYTFVCDWFQSSMGFVWVDGHMVCQDGNVYQIDPVDMDSTLAIDTSSRGNSNKSLPFRAHFYYNGTTTRTRDRTEGEAETIGLSVQWIPSQTIDGRLSSASDSSLKSRAVPIPTTQLSPILPFYEQRRDQLQRKLASSGWGPWLHNNMLSLVLLPDAATVSIKICHTTNTTAECIERAVPDGAHPFRPTDPTGADTRVGHHAYDRSYVQYYVGPSPNIPLNISVDYHVNNHTDFDMRIQPIKGCHNTKLEDDYESSNVACNQFVLILEFRYVWFKAGKVQTNSDNGCSATFSPVGRPKRTIYLSNDQDKATTICNGIPNATSERSTISINLGDGPVVISTIPNRNLDVVTTILENAKKKEEQLLLDTYGGDKNRAAQGQAIKAAAMWTLISTPAENGGAPIFPISRAWVQLTPPCHNDFTYVLFDWDNFFASLLVASGKEEPNKTSDHSSLPLDYAVSNLIQVAKTKTSSGFIPNFAVGGKKTQDRSEPPVGAKVTLELVKKFGIDRMSWVVLTIFDDLLDWNDWFVRKRIHQPLDMISLGAYNDQTKQAAKYLQYAKFESGLDNSPMYDVASLNQTSGCGWFESGCGLMNMYDVGMTSLFVQEAQSLAQLAQLIGRPQSLVRMLQQRGDDMAEKIRNYMWDEHRGVFVNRYTDEMKNNDSLSKSRVSPTSFYPLFAKAATDEQVERMANEWLFNSSRFCISKSGDFSGNTNECYWGLPSIEASDPAFSKLGYWRGYIWGPMALLTYWALLEYDHVPAARAARRAMCEQMASLMMQHWNAHRHICENYNPHKNDVTTNGDSEADCSGTRFYHWGALNGLIGILEDDRNSNQ